MGVIDKVAEALHLKHHDKTAEPSGSATTTRIFDQSKVTVIFVLGGPGAGKGTECAELVRDYGFVHLSAGDLLRAEQNREGSQYGELIRECIREGKIVPMEVTIKLLENAIGAALEEPHPGPAWGDGKGIFLVDGFPRQMDQALAFDDTVCLSAFTLFFSCTEEIMLKRILERGKTSGREDDNVESIKKRFRTFVDTSMPVIDHYRAQNKVVEIDGTQTIAEVHTATTKAMDAKLAELGVQISEESK